MDNQDSVDEIEVVDLRPRPRYKMNFAAERIHVPMPSQICFFVETPREGQESKASDIKVVQILSCSRRIYYDPKWDHIKIGVCYLDLNNGHPTGKECNITVPVRSGKLEYYYPPTFVPAIDRWDTVPDARQAYSDVLDVFEHGFGLVNAKYLDIAQRLSQQTDATNTMAKMLENEMAHLRATLARLVPSTEKTP